MEFEYSEKSQRIQPQLNFIAEHVAPRNAEHYRLVDEEQFPAPFIEDLKAKARAAGLWNLFLPGLKADEPGTQMSNLDYAPCAEIMGRIYWSSEVFNCSAPPTPATWSSCTSRPPGAEATVAEAAARRKIRSCLRDDRAGGRVIGCRPTSAPRSSGTATTGSSTAANGSSPTPPTRAASS